MDVRNILKKLFSLASVFVAVGVTLLVSCQVGLGESVDTSRPVVSIETPVAADVKSGVITISGTCDDDKSVEIIRLTLRNSDANIDCGELTSSEKKVKISEDKQSWTFEFDTRAYTDAKYLLSAVATDSSGKESPSAQRSFDIDNTAPVLAVSKPNTVNIDAPSAFGRTVSIKGDVVDDHNIKSMTVNFYAVDSEKKIGEKKSVTIDSVDKTSTNFVVAQYLNDVPAEGRSKILYDNYLKLFGNGVITETSCNYVTIELEDIAGNRSDCSYIKDDLVQVLKKKLGADATVESSDIKNIINGTYAYVSSSANLSELQKIVNENAVSKTDFSSPEKTLVASMSTKSNPTYQVGLKSRTSKNADGKISYVSYASGSSFTITVNAGADGTNIDPKTMKVLFFELDEKGERKSEKPLYKFEGSKYFKYADGKEESADGLFIFDGNNVSVDKLSPTDSASYTVSPPLLRKGLCCEVVVTGEDINGLDLNANPPADSFYAFTVISSSVPPAVSFDSSEKYVSLADLKNGCSFTGRISSAAAYDERKDPLTVSIVRVTDEEGKDVGVNNFIYKSKILTEVPDDENFVFTIRADNTIEAEYLDFELKFTATNSEESGDSIFHFYADGTAPIISELEIGEEKNKFVTDGKSIDVDSMKSHWFGKTVPVRGSVREFTRFNFDSKFGSGVASNSFAEKVFVTTILENGTEVRKTFTISNDDTSYESGLTPFESVVTFGDGINKIKFTLEDSVGNRSESAEYVIQVDTKKPVLDSFVAIVKNSKNESVKFNNKESVAVDQSLILGGTERQNAVFRISAKDENGILGMTVEFKSGEKVISKYASAGISTDTAYREAFFDAASKTMTLPEISFSSDDFKSASGNITASIVIYDPAGNSDSYERTFVLDNEGPVISGIRPKSEEEKTGHTELSGSAMDGKSDVTAIEYLIPTVEQQKKSDSLLHDETWHDSRERSSTVSSWQFNFNGIDNAELNDFADEGFAVQTQNGSGVWLIPIYIRGTDSLGNKSIYRDYKIRFNPDADRPSASVSIPEEGSVVGGKISVSGSAKDNTAVSKVYLQFDFGSEGKVSGGSDDGKGNGVITWNNSWSADDFKTKVGDSAYAAVYANKINRNESWWGIPVEGTSNWSFDINTKGELNYKPENENDKRTVSHVRVRACAVDENNKRGAWSEPHSFKIDTTAPYVESYSLVQLSGNNEKLSDRTVSASQAYTADMYVSGKWYVEAKLVDDTAITAISIQDGGSNVSDISNYINVSLDNGRIPLETKNIVLRYPISEEQNTGSRNIKFTLEDGDKNKNNFTYSVNYDNDAPVTSALKDTSGNEIAMTKVSNNNRVVTIKSTAQDEGSGFARTALYFMRSTDNKIELPLPKNDNAAWISDSGSAYAGDKSALTEQDGLYGKKIPGIYDRNTFTASSVSDVSSNKFIRAGGLIKIGALYHKIIKVDGPAVTFEGEAGKSEVYAFFPAAIIVDNTSSETPSWTNGSCFISRDDGDGIVEEVIKSGSSWTWEASLFSDELQDGEVTLVYVTFDNAGKYRKDECKFMIANNTPRLAKVFLATDLNGDGKYSDTELVGSVMKNDKSDQKYFSALTNGTSGKVQEIVTLENAADSKTTGLTMRNNLCFAFEFVSGIEGCGAGNGDIKYQVSVGPDSLSAPVKGTKGIITALGRAKYDDTASSVTAGIISSNLKGFELKATEISGFTEWIDADPNTHELSNIGITLWDSTKGTSAGTGDEFDDNGKITEFGSQWTVVNVPLYVDLKDDKKPTSHIDSLYASDGAGHIDYCDDWKLVSSYDGKTTGTQYDSNDKVSGTIVFEGVVQDEKKINKISIGVTNGTETIVAPNTQVAHFANGSLYAGTSGNSMSESVSGATFEITTAAADQFSVSGGHKVAWKLTIDTAKLSSVAGKDIVLAVSANDGTNANLTDGTDGKKSSWQMDVVPYITKISSENAYYRSMHGNYSVSKGDTIKVEGYNLGSSSEFPTVNVGTNQTVEPETTDNYSTFSFHVPEYSGQLYVTVNGIRSLNDLNNNKSDYNHESKSDDENATTDGGFDYLDNRYIYVWDRGHKFVSADDNAHKPVMTSDYDGNLFAAWTLMGAGQQQIEKGLGKSSVRVMQHYDQPNEYSAIGIDKSKSGGAISSLVINENVGDGGVMSTNGFSAVSNCGGAFGISIDNALTVNQTDTTANAGKQSPRIANNPFTVLDSNWSTSGYSLSSYAMLRDSGKFSTPRTARHGDDMHYVYYNSKNQTLRYTYVKSVSSASSYGRNGNFTTESWIILDGNNSGYDRFHDKTSEAASKDLVGRTPGSSTKNSVTIPAAGWGDRIKSGADISVALAYTYNNINKIVCYDVTGVRWKGTDVTLSFNETYEKGTTKPDSVTVYTGAKSVADGRGSSAQSTNAGKFASLDLTSSGIPVVAYYDGKNTRLRIAYATSSVPIATNNWIRKDVQYTDSNNKSQFAKGGSHCSLKVDARGNIHIIYRDNKNQLAYIKGTGSVTSGFTFSAPEIIDDNTTGTYGTLSLINGTQPAAAYLNAEESDTGIKYAIRKSLALEDKTSSDVWDVMVVPVTEGYNPVGENLISCEANNGRWSVTEDSVVMNTVTSVVAYQSTRFDVSFLKSEK